MNSQVTINRVKTAQADTNALLQKVSQAETLSNALLARMTNAEAEAYNASKLANDTIDMATNMLETMQQFEQKVAGRWNFNLSISISSHFLLKLSLLPLLPIALRCRQSNLRVKVSSLMQPTSAMLCRRPRRWPKTL